MLRLPTNIAAGRLAAANAARLWSLIASAERHGLDSQRYQTAVLAELPTLPSSELDHALHRSLATRSC